MQKSRKARARSRVVTAAILTTSLAGAVTAAPASAAIDTTATAVQLAEALSVDPSIVTGASFVAVSAPHANAVSDTPLTSFPTNGGTYAILTTGNAALAEQPNSSGGTSQNNGGNSVRGNTDFDVTILKIDLDVPSNVNCLVGMDFQFLSEEYPEYVNTSFNDAFIAELDNSTWTTSGSTISAPDNFAFDPSGDVISINSTGNTAMSAAAAAGTTYDGATPLLTAATPITPGAHSLYLSIFDQGDRIFDSAVFVDKLRFAHVADPDTGCVPGATPVDPQDGMTVDVMPESSDNPINASKKKGVVSVAILTDGTFDAATVDPATVCFGDADDPSRRDCTEAHGTGHLEDVDGDGDDDLLLHFEASQTGIEAGDTQACLTGTTFAGAPVAGCDSIRAF